MLPLQRAVKSLAGLGLVLTLPAAAFGQAINSTNFYAPQASEYDPLGAFPGDQANPSLSFNASGGFLVWQDNITDGDGLGISAIRLDSTLSPVQSAFRVNVGGTADQENPQVALLSGGGAAFVWQGGVQSQQHIYARFMSASNTWSAGDVMVNASSNFFQQDAAIAALPNGNAVVTWSSYGQDNADGMLGVFAQVFSPTGQKVGGEFQVNEFTSYNQRTPAVAAFPNGNFMIVWISEQQRSSTSVDPNTGAISGTYNSVDVYGRVFNSAGGAVGGEFLVNSATNTNTCADPSIAAGADGTYVVAWSQKISGQANLNNSWDIAARRFDANGVGIPEAFVNSQRYGDQYVPKVSADGTNYLVVWTSLAQDGSAEGVFGQFLNDSGGHAGGEMQVNTTVMYQQKFPAVASDGAGRFLVVFSSFNSVNVNNGLDLRAQRYSSMLQMLPAPAKPMVLALDSYSLSVTWQAVAGFNVSYYELFIDGSSTPEIVTGNQFSDFNFNPGETHTFSLAYVLSDGTVSPQSAAASGKTWGIDKYGYSTVTGGPPNPDFLPDDWETLYFGSRTNWPAQGLSTVLAPGVTVQDVFNWGADPTNSATWLRQWITRSNEGMFLNWNTVPGGIYQVLSSTNLHDWSPLGPPRFANGTTDTYYLGSGGYGYYKIVRNRY